MSNIMEKIKKYIKKKKGLYHLLLSVYQFFVFHEEYYGYLNTENKIKHLLIKLRKCYLVENRKGYDKKKQNQFIFIGTPNPDCIIKKGVFGDIELGNIEDYDCSFYTTHVLKNKKKEKLHKLYFSINKHIALPGKSLWERCYRTDSMKIKEDKNIFIIFSPGLSMSACFSQPRLWKRIFAVSEKTFCKRVLYLVDPVDRVAKHCPEIRDWFPFFDLIAGCAYEDHNKYGIEFIDTPCTNYKLKSQKSSYDIYMRGHDIGRSGLLRECYLFLKERGIKCSFHVCTGEQAEISEEGFFYTKLYLPYKEMLEEEMQANVLLEIVVPGVGSGATLRYHEAVIYGKKLLTNNPTVKKLSFYDERFIRYFEKPEDIDIEWIRASEKVEFSYQDEFSTVTFCKKLEQLA